MKAKDLIKILENVPDFDVQVILTEENKETGWIIKYTTFQIIDYSDIGYSNKIIQFEIE